MSKVKDIIVRVIPAKIANDFVRQYHYSGKVVNNSKLHFGCFLDDALHGVMSFGSPMDKRKVMPLVVDKNNEPLKWNSMLELNRMAFDEYLPRNSESRCLSIAFKLIRKSAPQVKWVLSFSDGTQSGDGTIYRATGFYLTGIGRNKTIYEMPDGHRVASIVLTNSGDMGSRKRYAKKYGAEFTSKASMKPFIEVGAKLLTGHMLRYIYLIDKTCKLTVPMLPFSKIDEMGAGMYRGENITIAERRKQAQEV